LTKHAEIKIIKAAKPAWAFCADKTTNEFLEAFLPEANICLLHTRAATVGNPEFNQNNHPMFLGNTAVVHNGTIHNHDFMFGQLKVARSADTDSDVFRAILDKEGFNEQALRKMNTLVGSAAIAAISQQDPNTLILARSGSPLIYGVTADKLWWASEIQAIQRAVRPWECHHGLWGRKFRSDVAYYTMPDNTAYILKPQGLDKRVEFKTCVNYKAPDYGNMRSSYFDKTRTWKKDSKTGSVVRVLPASTKKQVKYKLANCPNNSCKTLLEAPYTDKWGEYICDKCKLPLMALDVLKDDEMTYVTRSEE
jgi:asparagine synthetase B (glutamine-hydrolysing)